MHPRCPMRKRYVTRRAAAAVFSLLAGMQAAWACRTPPMNLSAEQQLAYASDVSLARVVRATPLKDPAAPAIDRVKLVDRAMAPVWERELPGFPGRQTPFGAGQPGGSYPVEYEFVVERRFLGPDRPSFTIIGTFQEPEGAGSRPEADFRQEAFWAPGGGRLVTEVATCYPNPSFAVGERYLVFQGRPMSARGAEHVATVDGRPDPDDQWLKYVEQTLAERANAR